jgi:hypothetical protein
MDRCKELLEQLSQELEPLGSLGMGTGAHLNDGLVGGIIPKWLLSAIFRLRNYDNSATKMGLAM